VAEQRRQGPGAPLSGVGGLAAADGPAAPDPPWQKSARQLERERVRRSAAVRSALIASVSTAVLFGGLVAAVVSSPGWPVVRETFFSWSDAKDAFPDIARGFWVNVKMFMIAEPLILVVALTVAVTRVSRAPLLFPLRALAVVYTDVFRGVPTLLVVYLTVFGVPALQLTGVTNDKVVLGITALTMSYGAYVAEVLRAGIDSVHPSQRSAARSLGLSHGQTLRYVVVPQAVRRVVPPLLNDFVSLQKDTALLASVGVVESLREANQIGLTRFVYTPYLVTAAFFLALTIPLARLTDWLGGRALRRQSAQGAT
jgi:polar amino acid transport system permease protein